MQPYDDRQTFLLPRPCWVNDTDVSHCTQCNTCFGPLRRRVGGDISNDNYTLKLNLVFFFFLLLLGSSTIADIGELGFTSRRYWLLICFDFWQVDISFATTVRPEASHYRSLVTAQSPSEFAKVALMLPILSLMLLTMITDYPLR